MSDLERGSNIGLVALVVGVQIKTGYALLVASQDESELTAFDKRVIEVGAMIELLELVKEPHVTSITWPKKQQDWLFIQRGKLEATS